MDKKTPLRSSESLQSEILDLKRQLFALRVKKVVSTDVTDTSAPRKIRKNIARLKTTQNMMISNA